MAYRRIDDHDDYVEQVDEEELVVEEPHQTSGASAFLATIAWTVGIIGIVVVALLAFRLGFEMGDANPNSNAVDAIYDLTGPLVQPFQGVADANQLDNGGIFYPETAIAMGAYLVAAALLMITLYAWASYFNAADGGQVVRRTRMVRGH
jgi:uncharacterized protein YggT (Ycf19 family)